VIMDVLILLLDRAVDDLSQMVRVGQTESALPVEVLQVEGPAEYFDDELAEHRENIRDG